MNSNSTGDGKKWSREQNRFPKTAPRIHRSISFLSVMNLPSFFIPSLFPSNFIKIFSFLTWKNGEEFVVLSHNINLPRGLKLQLVTGLFVNTWPIKASKPHQVTISKRSWQDSSSSVPDLCLCNPFRTFTLSTQICGTLPPFHPLFLSYPLIAVLPARETRSCTHFAL